MANAPGDDGAVGGCAQMMGAPPPPAIGTIQTVTGLVTVMDARGAVAQVKVGDHVYRHDTIADSITAATNTAIACARMGFHSLKVKVFVNTI